MERCQVQYENSFEELLQNPLKGVFGATDLGDKPASLGEELEIIGKVPVLTNIGGTTVYNPQPTSSEQAPYSPGSGCIYHLNCAPAWNYGVVNGYKRGEINSK